MSSRFLAAPTTGRLGTWALVVLLVVAATGIPILLTYDPSPDGAHASVAREPSLLRGVHAWGASLLIVLLALYGSRAWLAPKVPAWTWVPAETGLAWLALVLAAYETGTVLKWDQQGWEALLHVQAGAGLFGLHLADATDPSRAPLRGLLLVHALVLPLLLALAIAAHWRPEAGWKTWVRERTALLAADWPALAGLGALLLAAALLAPPRLGPAPVAGLYVSRPEWPFLWIVPFEDAFGTRGLWALPMALLAAGVLLWPAPAWSPRARRLAGAAGLLLFLVLSVLGALK